MKTSKRILIIALAAAFTVAFIGGIAVGAYTIPDSSKNDRDITQVSSKNDSAEPCSLDKPVIYLYGYNNEDVEVELDLNGKFTCTYPKISGNKWKVTAQKDGILKYNNKTYNYLYWEGTTTAKFDFDKGFCIKGDETAKFLEESLSKLGLAGKEINDFITYWLPRMQNNPYNVISFQGADYRDIAKLTVKPEPKKIIRVFMAYYPSKTPVEIDKQELTGNAIRSSNEKYVVEWGGAMVNEDTLQSDSIGIDNAGGEGDDALIQRLAQKTPEELQYLLARTVEYKKSNGEDTDLNIEISKGHNFTDKTGRTVTFTNAEWEFLRNTWAYTGNPDAVISQFTVDELRAWLNNNYRK